MPETDTKSMTKTELGLYLRQARESKGLQIEDVSKTTRISKNYLIALEQGEFQQLPNPAYVKGFLRLYAGVVGLSGDEVVAIYDREDNAAPVFAEEQAEETTNIKKPSAKGRWLLPLLILAAVLVAALFMPGEEKKKVVVPAVPPPVSTPPVVAQPTPPVQPVLSSAQPASKPTTPTTSALPSDAVPGTPDSQQKGIFLKLKCIKDSTLNITIDDSFSQQYELKAGDVIEWKAEDSFSLDIGNAGGLEGEFNGKPLKPFGAQGVSTHVVLTAEGAK